VLLEKQSSDRQTDTSDQGFCKAEPGEVRYCEFEEMGRLEDGRGERTGPQSLKDANALGSQME
jgi:hypothetical protein